MSFFLAMAIMVLPDQIAHPTLDEIRRGLEIRDARFQRAAFRVTYHDRLLNGRGGPFLGRLQVINALVDAEGNARIDVVARETAPADSKEGIDRTYTEITGK